MACKTESKDIGDHEYSVTQWSATKSMKMKFRLIKVFGASIAKIAAGSNSKIKDDADSISEGLELLFANSSSDDIVNLIKECIIDVGCDGKRVTVSRFEELFSGDDQVYVYKVFLFVMRVNYSNLMKGQLGESLLAKITGSPSTDVSTPT